jgi:hypothetical protein
MDLNGIYIKDSAGAESDLFGFSDTSFAYGFMGLAPGMVGVYQVNFIMPSVASGNATIGLAVQTCRPVPFGSQCELPGTLVVTVGTPVIIPVRGKTG